jgi:hypothetical protein
MPDRVNLLEGGFPITKIVGVLAAKPPNEVSMVKVKVEQGNAHMPGTCLVDGVAVCRGTLRLE